MTGRRKFLGLAASGAVLAAAFSAGFASAVSRHKPVLTSNSTVRSSKTMATTPIRIGFSTDLSGPYQSVDGPAGADAIRMAIEDLGNTVAGCPVQLLLGDHRNDKNVAASLARRWYAEEGVDVVISGVNSDTSLAMTAVAVEYG